MQNQPPTTYYSLKNSNLLAIPNSSQVREQSRITFLSPNTLRTPNLSRDVSPVQMTLSYYQDSGQKSPKYSTVPQRNTIPTILHNQTGQTAVVSHQLQQPQQKQQLKQPLKSSQSSKLLTITNNQNINTPLPTFQSTNGLNAPSSANAFFNSDNRTLNTPKYQNKAMTFQDVNVSHIQESSKRKNIQDLENSLLKERNTISALQAEKEYISNKLKDNESQLTHFSSQVQGYSPIQSTKHSKEETNRLFSVCKEKDQIIANLMDEISEKPSREATEAERRLWLNQIQNYKNSIIELENKITMLSIENERLNRKLTDKESEIQKIISDGTYNEEKLKIEIDELRLNYEDQINKILEENRQEMESWKIKQVETEERLQKQFRNQSVNSEEYGEVVLKNERDRLLNELKLKEEEKINLLLKIVIVTAENEKNHNQIISQIRIIDDLHFEIRQREQKFLLLEADQNILLKRNEDLQKKIEQLIDNIDELNVGLKTRIEEVEIWRSKFSEMQIQLENKISLCEQEKVNIRQRHAKELEAQKFEDEEKLKKSRSQSIIEYQQKCNSLSDLQKELEECNQQLMVLQRNHTDQLSARDTQEQLLQEKSTLIEELQEQLQGIKRDFSKTDKILLDFQQENENLNQRLQNLENTNNRLIEEFQRRIQSKEEELENIQRDRLIKVNEIDSLKSKLEVIEDEMERRMIVHSDLQIKFKQLIEENEKLINIADDCERMRIELQQMESLRIALLKLENEFEEQKYQHTKNLEEFQEDLSDAEEKRRMQQQSDQQRIEDMNRAHQNEIEGIKMMLQRDFEKQFDSHSSQLKMIIADHEREIAILKQDIDKLLGDLNLERNKMARILGDLDQANREADMWRSKAGQKDPNHPYILEMSSQLELKRMECLEYQTRIHEIERRRHELERDNLVIARKISRTPSMDSFKHMQLQKQPVIVLDRPVLDLGMIEENDKLNRMVLNRCREIVHQKY